MKHNVASVGLISIFKIAENIPTRHCTCDIPNMYMNHHNTQV